MKLGQSLFVKEAILFGAVQVLGLWAVFRFLNDLKLNYLAPEFSTDFHLNLSDLFILVAFVFIFIFLARKRGRASVVFFRVFLWLIVFSGAQIIFSLFLSPINTIIFSLMVVLTMALAPRVIVLNVAVILGLAGVGSIVGLAITPLVAVWVLAILSIYDIMAVYVTKHMVQIAEGMIASRAIFGFIIPAKLSGFKEKLSVVRPGENFMILGSGDIVLPLILTASLARSSFWQAMAVAVFSVFGLLLTHLIFVNQKERRPMAALPPIAALSIVGYLITTFVF